MVSSIQSIFTITVEGEIFVMASRSTAIVNPTDASTIPQGAASSVTATPGSYPHLQNTRFFTSKELNPRPANGEYPALPPRIRPDESFFAPLLKGIDREGGLLHPKLKDLVDSFVKHEAVVVLDYSADSKGQAVGYVRLEPLLHQRVREALGLSSDFPNISELGTMFVDQSARGKHFATRMTRALIGQLSRKEGTHKRDFALGRDLIIGTAKDIRVLRALEGPEGVQFHTVHHDRFPHIAAFTCICRGDFGRGYQYSRGSCQAQLGQEYRDITSHGNLLPVLQNSNKIPCTMFVSDLTVAMQVEERLAGRFPGARDSVEALRLMLIELGYYPSKS